MIERTTTIPNQLLDETLPRLKDTELRVLLVVLRATIGWSDPATGRRKSRDWISSSQMQKRTGRSAEAVSAAIDALVQQEMIVAEDTTGNSLLHRSERRRYIGRLYFRPGQMWKTGDRTHPGKAKRTKVSFNKNRGGQLPKAITVVSHRGSGGWMRAVDGASPVELTK